MPLQTVSGAANEMRTHRQQNAASRPAAQVWNNLPGRTQATLLVCNIHEVWWLTGTVAFTVDSRCALSLESDEERKHVVSV